MKEQKNSLEMCCCQSGDQNCCGSETEKKIEKRSMTIDFLFLDLSVCTRCQGTDQALDDAIREVAKVLALTGVEVVVNKINVLSEALAIQYQFESSPTIRINGRDIQLEVRESSCQSCGDLCGDEVDCRTWVYGGIEYSEPPKAMIVEAILKAVYGNEQKPPKSKVYVLPENLKKFYVGLRDQDDSPCC